MDSSAAVVAFKNVSLSYNTGPEVFSRVSFQLSAGSFHFLTGPSGAGKSSLINLIHLGHQTYRGSVKLFQRETRTITFNEMPHFRQRIGIVFQDYQLLDHMCVVDNVALPLRVRGIKEKAARQHAGELLSWIGLGSRLYENIDVLSGGEKQRVAIARSVISHPKLLLADEPTGNVDDKIAVKLLYLFEQLHKMGTTVVIATHNRDLVREFSHPVLHLEKGRLTHTHLPSEEKDLKYAV